MWFANISSQSVICLFIVLPVSSEEQKFIIFMKFNLSIFSFMTHTFGFVSKKSLSSTGCFWVFVFVLFCFYCLNCLGFIFVNGLRYCSNFFQTGNYLNSIYWLSSIRNDTFIIYQISSHTRLFLDQLFCFTDVFICPYTNININININIKSTLYKFWYLIKTVFPCT